jgi:hypothetical protein
MRKHACCKSHEVNQHALCLRGAVAATNADQISPGIMHELGFFVSGLVVEKLIFLTVSLGYLKDAAERSPEGIIGQAYDAPRV